MQAAQIDLPGFRVEILTQADAARAQPLFEACADYALMESGALPPADAASIEFRTTPPGRTTDDKFIFCLAGESREVVALLIADRGWPNDGSWWIALMLVHPAQRGSGVAARFAEAILTWIDQQGMEGGIERAVFEENKRAERFWTARGFSHVRATEPRAIGRKTHVLQVMRRSASH
jgi:GNAT superfamily N-acetyltransferase